jgi:DNA recombination protein RmuC
VVELAGMVEHCDFAQQVTLVGEEGRLRPDMIVRMPGGRQVIVDAKVPLDGYLLAMEATTEDERRARMREHAGQLRAHLQRLGSKAYWSELPGTPEFVVMFLPGETIFAAALEEMPTLIEDGVARRVLLATPTTLIALLQTVHYGWRQERLAESAEKISEQGRLLHERVATLLEHWSRLGGALGKATEHFNAAAASFEGRLLPAARRLEELGAGSKKDLPELPRLDARPRLVSASAALGEVP